MRHSFHFPCIQTEGLTEKSFPITGNSDTRQAALRRQHLIHSKQNFFRPGNHISPMTAIPLSEYRTILVDEYSL